MANLNAHLKKIYAKLDKHEKRLKTLSAKELFRKFFKNKLDLVDQKNTYFGMHLALCIDTRDPFKQNRVKYFDPSIHIPLKYSSETLVGGGTGESQATKISELDWAWPISAMGGFDDAGLSWVPPAGSMLCIFYMRGSSNIAFYAGTTWYRDKGPIQHDIWNYHIPEYYKLFEGHRSGYMVGQNDESQVFPPDNTSNYQGYDIDSDVDNDGTTDAETKTTWPHQYSQVTPEKHRVIMDDGDPKCNRRWKRFELMSSLGNLILMKDDMYHPCGEWLNPQCFVSYTEVIPTTCAISMTILTDPINNFISFVPVEVPLPCPQGPENCNTITPETPSLTVDQEYIGKGTTTLVSGIPSITGREDWCPSKTPFISVTLPDIPSDCLNGIMNGVSDFCFTFNNMGKNKYQKHRQQCFPYLCQDCGLNQSGIQVRSRSGATILFDDSVEEPRGKPEWELTLKPFDMDGCTGRFLGRTYWKSATGAFIELNDAEDQPKLRGARNGVTISTACGNKICLNDQTLPGNIAGPLNGIHVQTNANHTLDMVNDANRLDCAERGGCVGKPGAYAKNALIKLRTGYGTTMIMFDGDQTKTDQQYFQIMSPQRDNLVRGPHVLHMQETANGAGQVFLRAGGDLVLYSYDNMVEVIGDEKDNPSNKMEFISGNKLVNTKNLYYNKAGMQVFWSDDKILLLAGADCVDEDGTAQPCMYPVAVCTKQIPDFISAATGIVASEHVFASALQDPINDCEGIASDS